jgi:hypothetical protein
MAHRFVITIYDYSKKTLYFMNKFPVMVCFVNAFAKLSMQSLPHLMTSEKEIA